MFFDMITLWWKSWSWKTTVWQLLADKLWFERISIGDIKKKLAEDMGMTMLERDQLWDKPENREEFDLKYEDYQKSLNPHWDTVLDWRMAFWCQPTAFNVFLNISLEESAQRIFNAERWLNGDMSLEGVVAMTKTRNERHSAVYKELYDVDIFDFEHYDLVISSDSIHAVWIAETIVKAYTAWKETMLK